VNWVFQLTGLVAMTEPGEAAGRRVSVSSPLVDPRPMRGREGVIHTSLPHHRPGRPPRPISTCSAMWARCLAVCCLLRSDDAGAATAQSIHIKARPRGIPPVPPPAMFCSPSPLYLLFPIFGVFTAFPGPFSPW